MPYTFTSQVIVWIGVLGVVALAASGTIGGTGLLLLVAVAFALPALLTLVTPPRPDAKG